MSYADGSNVYDTTDVESQALGHPWQQSRSWTSLNQFSASYFNGRGGIDKDLPVIQRGNGDQTLSVMAVGGDISTFDLTTGTNNYTAKGHVQDKLTHPTGEFVLTDILGNKTRYYDFSDTVPGGQRGRF